MSVCRQLLRMSRKMKIACQYGPTNTFYVATPIGDVEVVSCPKGLHSVSQVGDNDESFAPDRSVEVKIRSQMYQDNGYTYKPAVACAEWLRVYFSDTHSTSLKAPTICSSLTQNDSFTSQVWMMLKDKVSFGQTVSYGQLAAMCGNMRASRAVGMAMRNNPLSLIIPCHRVIQSGGQIGNYHGGKKNLVKVWLLKHEGAIK